MVSVIEQILSMLVLRWLFPTTVDCTIVRALPVGVLLLQPPAVNKMVGGEVVSSNYGVKRK
jgi:hypothetical protein